MKREANVAEGKEALRGKRKQNVVRDNKEEMTMKKQVFGAILLSAALAVGTCMPAFAVDTPSAGDVGEVDVVATTDGAATAVKVSTTISQINVALPLSLPIVADQAGGDAIEPTNYYIQNLTRSDLKIENVAWNITDEQSNNWNLNRSTGIAAGAVPMAYGTADTGKTGTPAYGSLALSLTPVASDDTSAANQSGTGVAGSELQIVGTATNTLSNTARNMDWTIGKTVLDRGNVTTANGNKMFIKVDASSSVISKAIDVADQTDVIKIIYTVSAA